MDINDIRKLAEMNVEETATDGYDVMLFGFENVPESHKTNCIENILMPMIQKHKDMAEELLEIREGLDKLAKKLENQVNEIDPPQQDL